MPIASSSLKLPDDKRKFKPAALLPIRLPYLSQLIQAERAKRIQSTSPGDGDPTARVQLQAELVSCVANNKQQITNLPA